MRHIHRQGCAALLLAACHVLAHAACPPEGSSVESLRQLKAQHWVVADPMAVEPLAFGLLDCLADPNPELRDDLAFDALSTWMRGDKLSPDAVRRIGASLLPWLEPALPDPQGVTKPFAALTLSEVARYDRLRPVFTGEERDQLVSVAATYLAGVRDYRGFDEHDGWRHAVAHGADLALQLALNPALDGAQLDRLLDAIGPQVLPQGAVFYHYGEGDRLARPVLFIARRGLHDAAFWDQWLGRIATAAMPAAGVPQTQASLARLHNAKAFLWPMYAAVQQGHDDTLNRLLLAPLLGALRQLP